MTHIVMIVEITKMGYRSDSSDRRNQYRQSRGRPRYEQNYRRRNFRGNVRSYQDFGRQNSRGEYRGNYRNEDYSRGRGKIGPRERSFFSNNNSNDRRNDVSIVSVDQVLDQKQVQKEIESGAISVENMIILQKIVPHPKKKET